MVDQVDCPNCGKGNDREMVESYRVCVHCGGDMTSVAGPSPMSDLQRSIDGEQPQAQQQPPQQYPPPQQQPPPYPQPQQQPPPYPQPQQQPPPYPQPQQQPPPGYAQPQQGYGAQPYGGQPYPPPGFAPGPGYGYPPVGMYPPTYHPGLYERPEREPYIDVGNLFKLLFRPQEAFEDLYDHTTSTQGYILAIIFIVISGVVGLAANLAVLGTIDLPDESGITGLNTSNGAMSIVGIFTGIAFFFVTAWIFHAMVKEKGRHPSLSKTIGMMGYAKFPFFIISLLMAVITPFLLVDATFDDPDSANLGAVCGLLALIVVLGLIGMFWSFWVHAHSQSVANDISTGTAMGYLLLAWIIVGILSSVVSFVIALAVVGTTI